VSWPLGVVDVVYWPRPAQECAALAADDGFAHIDVLVDVDPASLALPIGCPTAFPWPRSGWCACPAPSDAPGMWDETVRRFRSAPGALLEPWSGSVVNSDEKCRAMVEAVPGLRLLVDTGHVADWGGDPIAMLELAGHVQLRQGRRGTTQVHVDDRSGVVDFEAVLRQLDGLGYDGVLSVEYFDLPDYGWPLDDPRVWANDLAASLRPLLT
jgi:sugar phosphate isomerase/epimerase